ncbi:diguanylate cyclase [Xanthobacteraceae bacterium A53D]
MQASRSADNLVLLVNRDIQRHFDIFTVTLRGLRHYLELEGVLQDPERLQRALAAAADGAIDVSSINVLDTDGRVIAESARLIPSDLDLSDRDYFQIQRDRAYAGIHLSAPYRSRADRGVPSLVLSARITDKAGAFLGVLALAFRLTYVGELFQSLERNPGDIISLINTKGIMLVRMPSWNADGDMGLDISGSESFRQMASDKSGAFVARSLIDGVPRYYHFERISDLPLIVTVGLGLPDIFAQWRQRAWIIGSAAGLICLTVLGASLLLRRAIIARNLADTALRRLSETDGLTGIANRRRFDEHLALEWGRAKRTGGALSLLMIDADRFKGINDRFGHAQGDEVLKVVARICGEGARRPADLAARYGGEEFALILPETAVDTARAIAEGIRAAMEREAQRAEAMTTVSVGVATLRPKAGGEVAGLVAEADHALYRAKANGRNRVER